MAKNDTRDTFIDALNILSSAAVELHGVNTMAREQALERDRQDKIRQEDREFKTLEREQDKNYQRELQQLNRTWQMEYDNVKSLQDKELLLMKEYEALEDQFEASYGALPANASNNAVNLLANEYKGPMDDFDARRDHYKGQILGAMQNMDNIKDLEQGLVKEAKQYLSDKFPEYWNEKGMEDNVLLQEELDMLITDWKAGKKDAAVQGLTDAISIYEAGDRTGRTNNPGGILYNPNKDWWGHEYGATFQEDDKFWEYTDNDGKRHQVFTDLARAEAEKSGYEVKEHVTATFPTVEQGRSALESRVTQLVDETGGDYDRLVDIYSGAEGETLQNYQKAIESLNLLSMDEIALGAKVMQAEYNAKPYHERVQMSKQAWDAKASEHNVQATSNITAIQGYFLNPKKNPAASSFGDTKEGRAQFKQFKDSFSEENWKVISGSLITRKNPEEFYDYLKAKNLDHIIWDVAQHGGGDKKGFGTFGTEWWYLRNNLKKMMDYKHPERATDVPGFIGEVISNSDDLDRNIVDFNARISVGGMDVDQVEDFTREFLSQAQIKYREGYKGMSASRYILSKLGESAQDKNMNRILQSVQASHDDPDQTQAADVAAIINKEELDELSQMLGPGI